MKYHYTYRITNTATNMHYYGDRSSIVHPAEDLGKKYFSSFGNKFFRVDQKENPQDYKYKIIKIFSTRKEAKALESKLHRKFNVRLNEHFINRGNQDSSNFSTEGTIYAKDKSGNEFMISIEDPRYKSGEVIPIRAGLVSCFNINTEKVEVVEPELFQNSAHLVASTASKMKVDIYNAQGEMVFDTYRNFKKVCHLNKLPYQALRLSYQNGGEPIYSKSKESLSVAKRHNLLEYVGWYAIKVAQS